jgi:hypothetical protein
MRRAACLLLLLTLLTGCKGITFVQRGHQGQLLLEGQGEEVRCLVPDNRGEMRYRTGTSWCSFPGAVPADATYPNSVFPEP